MASVRSLQDLSRLFIDESGPLEYSWFFLPEGCLVRDGRQFARKAGSRPVFLLRIAGPNSQVIPRSSSVPVGVFHQSHHRCIPSCRVNKDGYVKRDLLYPVLTSDLIADYYSCSEQAGSKLLNALGLQ